MEIRIKNNTIFHIHFSGIILLHSHKKNLSCKKKNPRYVRGLMRMLLRIRKMLQILK